MADGCDADAQGGRKPPIAGFALRVSHAICEHCPERGVRSKGEMRPQEVAEKRSREVARYLISFDDGAMTFPEEELPDVCRGGAHGGPRGQGLGCVGVRWRTPFKGRGERGGHRWDGHPTASTGRARRTLADSRSSTCPRAGRRWSGLPSSPLPAAALKRSASPCLARRPDRRQAWEVLPAFPEHARRQTPRLRQCSGMTPERVSGVSRFARPAR